VILGGGRAILFAEVLTVGLLRQLEASVRVLLALKARRDRTTPVECQGEAEPPLSNVAP